MTCFTDPVLDFASQVAATTSRAERIELLSHAVQPFGIGMFAYATFGPDQGVRSLETTYPDEWIAHYVRSGYSETDIVAIEGRRAVLPFEWRALLDRPDTTAAARQIFCEAAGFGIRDGLTVPMRIAGSSALISFVLDDRSLLATDAMAARHAVQLMAMYYHSAASCDPVAAEQPSADILTPREREMLQWTARGKTGWEIGQILHLSERTVTFHIENAKAKLGVASRSHATVRAIMLGLISV